MIHMAEKSSGDSNFRWHENRSGGSISLADLYKKLIKCLFTCVCGDPARFHRNCGAANY
jgi:hypothetical protein